MLPLSALFLLHGVPSQICFHPPFSLSFSLDNLLKSHCFHYHLYFDDITCSPAISDLTTTTIQCHISYCLSQRFGLDGPLLTEPWYIQDQTLSFYPSRFVPVCCPYLLATVCCPNYPPFVITEATWLGSSHLYWLPVHNPISTNYLSWPSWPCLTISLVPHGSVCDLRSSSSTTICSSNVSCPFSSTAAYTWHCFPQCRPHCHFSFKSHFQMGLFARPLALWHGPEKQWHGTESMLFPFTLDSIQSPSSVSCCQILNCKLLKDGIGLQLFSTSSSRHTNELYKIIHL